MNIQKTVNRPENETIRFSKLNGPTAEERAMQYHSGACRYDLECALKVLKSTALRMGESQLDELYELNLQNAAANAVLTTFFDLSEAMSIWHAMSVEEDTNTDKTWERRLFAEMEGFDAAVVALKPYLQPGGF